MKISKKRCEHDLALTGINAGSRKDEMGASTRENINTLLGIFTVTKVICFTSGVSFLDYLIPSTLY